jgi:hypothetical protein
MTVSFRERGSVIVTAKVGRDWRSWIRLARTFTWQSALLEGDADFLALYIGRRGSLYGGAMMLSREHVMSLSLRQGWSKEGVRFELDDDHRIVIFYTTDAEQLLTRLEGAGWGTRPVN